VQTRFGAATAVRLLLLVAMAPLLLGLSRWSRTVLAAGWSALSVGVLLSTSAVGHAAAGDLVALAMPADTVHLAAVSAWLGGLVLMAVVLLRRPVDSWKRCCRAGPATPWRRWVHWWSPAPSPPGGQVRELDALTGHRVRPVADRQGACSSG
jgi:putative copper export protein